MAKQEPRPGRLLRTAKRGVIRMTQATMEMHAETLGLEPLFTIKDLAAYLQVSTTMVYRLIKDGALAGTRIGQSLRFTRKNVEDLLGLCAFNEDQ